MFFKQNYVFSVSENTENRCNYTKLTLFHFHRMADVKYLLEKLKISKGITLN